MAATFVLEYRILLKIHFFNLGNEENSIWDRWFSTCVQAKIKHTNAVCTLLCVVRIISFIVSKPGSEPKLNIIYYSSQTRPILTVDCILSGLLTTSA